MKSKKRITFNAPVTLSFALISLAVLLLQNILGRNFTYTFCCAYRSSLLNPLTYLRLFTHVLGHSGFSHYSGNMLLLLLLGPILEEKYGSKTLFTMLLLTSAIEGIIITTFFNVAIMGASGIVFMFIILASVVNVKQGEIPLTFIIVAVLYIGREVINGIVLSDNVSQLAHIIGGACGGIFGGLMSNNRNSRL